nr:immunoglobulin heavy chain junction region [Macaca mulatta]
CASDPGGPYTRFDVW